jgi:hypothetical protein
MKSNHDHALGTSLHQQVVNLLMLRRGRWCCDGCLALALDRPEQHAVEYVTDTLAATDAYSRIRGFCRDCHRFKLVTMANGTTGPPRSGGEVPRSIAPAQHFAGRLVRSGAPM